MQVPQPGMVSQEIGRACPGMPFNQEQVSQGARIARETKRWHKKSGYLVLPPHSNRIDRSIASLCLVSAPMEM